MLVHTCQAPASCPLFISVYVLSWCHTGGLGINDAVSRAEPIWESDQLPTVSHL